MDANHTKKTVDEQARPAATAMTDTCTTGVHTYEAACAGSDIHDACSSTVSKPGACANTHDGKLVSISGNTLVMSSHEGTEYSHTVAADAKVCCDGTACRAQDLTVGSKIRLTTRKDDNKVAIKIESLDKQTEFAQSA